MSCDLNIFSAKNFFDVQSFTHSSLFVENKPVWDVLLHLEAYIRAHEKQILSDIEGVSLTGKEDIYIGHNCKIGPNVFIEGPAIIGNNCEIRHSAYIRAGTIISDGCLVGHASEIVRSFLLPQANLPHFNYVGDSIVGRRVNLGAGSKCANVRLDKGPISISYKKGRIKTEMKKLGAIIGDNCSIGCNTVLNPGSILFSNVAVPPCRTVIGVMEH